MTWTPLANADDLPRLEGGSLIDSHCHLDIDAYDSDRDAVIARAARAGVSAMVTIGASGTLSANWRAVELARAHAGIFATVGVHPHEASQVTDGVIDQLVTLGADPRVVGIGETGLDYHYDHSPREQQRVAFRRFVHVARQLGRPLVVHLRVADADALTILREEHASEVGGVIHCFSSDRAAARAFLDLGFHLSFSGIVTFKSADEVRAAAAITPVDRLLIETDAPFLAPVPYRGRRNEPALIVATATVLATLRNEPLAQLAEHTRANTERLFGLT